MVIVDIYERFEVIFAFKSDFYAGVYIAHPESVLIEIFVPLPIDFFVEQPALFAEPYKIFTATLRYR